MHTCGMSWVISLKSCNTCLCTSMIIHVTAQYGKAGWERSHAWHAAYGQETTSTMDRRKNESK